MEAIIGDTPSAEAGEVAVEKLQEVKLDMHKAWLDELRIMLPEKVMKDFVSPLALMEDTQTENLTLATSASAGNIFRVPADMHC